MNNIKLSKRLWFSILLFSLFGQIAWVVENMYFNVFIFQEFQATSKDIALMVSLSAIAATLTTLLMGALSDKVGKRKLFIVAGYILWGISIICFAFLKKDILSELFPYANSVILGVTLVIIFDCIMTFFGSTANDAALNAWITDVTNTDNRGRVEGFLASLPLVAVLAVFGGFMGLTANKQWDTIFLIIGSLVLFVGFLGIFLIKDVLLEHHEGTYFKNIIYGFRPSVVSKNRKLYYLFLCYAVFGIAVQVFMPYLIIYYQYRLELDNYVLIFAPAIVLASVATIFYGRLLDRIKFYKAAIFAIISFMIGLLILGLAEDIMLVFLGTLIMLAGNLSVGACFGAAIRDNTPVDKVGLFQGLRMFSYVLLPMLIGPWIGSSVIQTTDEIMGDDGILVKIPTSTIFIASLVVTVVLLILVLLFKRLHPTKPRSLFTKEGEKLDVNKPLPEYPRPQMVRKSYYSLNGVWNYKRTQGTPSEGTIVVPFPIGSTLSQVVTPLKKHEQFIYTKKFTLPDKFIKESTYLHIDGADQFAKIMLNGVEVGTTTNAYIPKSFDVSNLIKEDNELAIHITDPLDDHYPYGKQSHRPGGIWYTATSGLWKSVWLESVPACHLRRFTITPNLDEKLVHFTFDTDSPLLEVRLKNNLDITHTVTTKEWDLKLDNPICWTPEHPYCYDVEIKCGDDLITTYFAMRKVSIVMHKGHPVIALNNEPLFLSGVLDQGYYSDGLLTPASYACYQQDILQMKAMGFNILRKHIKIEPLRFYYECDHLGMLVWQDMVNNGSYDFFKHTARPILGMEHVTDEVTPKTRPYLEIFKQSMIDTVQLLYNTPSIGLWTIYNEGWGQIEADEMAQTLRQYDVTRLIDATSGWFHQVDSDLSSLHIYFKKIKINPEARPVVLSEFGGYSLRIPNHVTHDKIFGYRIKQTAKELEVDLETLYLDEVVPAIKLGLAAAIYTQLSDVEEEINGLVTFDRKMVKVDVDLVQAIHKKLKEAFE